jgi:hypothetical protein
MSEGVGGESDDLADPENLCVGFGISTLSSIEREIQLLLVWRPANQRFRCRSMAEEVGDESTDLVDPENLCTGFGIWTRHLVLPISVDVGRRRDESDDLVDLELPIYRLWNFDAI